MNWKKLLPPILYRRGGAGGKPLIDGEYIERLSFAFDCKCFFLTIWKVLKHDGVREGAAEAEKAEEAVK